MQFLLFCPVKRKLVGFKRVFCEGEGQILIPAARCFKPGAGLFQGKLNVRFCERHGGFSVPDIHAGRTHAFCAQKIRAAVSPPDMNLNQLCLSRRNDIDFRKPARIRTDILLDQFFYLCLYGLCVIHAENPALLHSDADDSAGGIGQADNQITQFL